MSANDNDEVRRELVANERIKLVANALDRASNACLTVGVFGPIDASLYGIGATASGAHGILLILGSVRWLAAAVALHVLARRKLGELQ